MLTPPGACYAYPVDVYKELKKMGYGPQKDQLNIVKLRKKKGLERIREVKSKLNRQFSGRLPLNGNLILHSTNYFSGNLFFLLLFEVSRARSRASKVNDKQNDY